jgi:hypothetical protein
MCLWIFKWKALLRGFIFFQYFKRDADELESWIYEKLQAASDESYKDPTNLQVRMEFCKKCILKYSSILIYFL